MRRYVPVCYRLTTWFLQGVYQEGLEKRKEALARTEHLSGEDHREEVAKDLRRIAQLMIQMVGKTW